MGHSQRWRQRVASEALAVTDCPRGLHLIGTLNNTRKMFLRSLPLATLLFLACGQMLPTIDAGLNAGGSAAGGGISLSAGGSAGASAGGSSGGGAAASGGVAAGGSAGGAVAGGLAGGSVAGGSVAGGSVAGGSVAGGSIAGGSVAGGVAGGSTAGGTSAGGSAGGAVWSSAPTFAASAQVSVMSNSIPVVIHYPTGGVGPFPMVVLLQGGNVSNVNYAAYASLVARYGFVVAIPERSRFFIVTGLFADYAGLEAGWAAMRAENMRAGSALNGKVDTSRSGVLGHSLGAAAGLEAIGNECSFQFCGLGGTFSRPAHLKAGVFYGGNRASPVGGNIAATNNGNIAVLLIQGSADGVASTTQGRTTYDRIANAPKGFLTLAGGNHYSVTDTQAPAGAMPDSSAATLTQAVSIETIGRWTGAFLQAHVAQNAAALRYVTVDGDPADLNVTLVQPTTTSPGSTLDTAGRCTFVRSSGTVGSVPVTILLPSVTAPVPAVVFNPGTQIASSAYDSTLEHLASWCYVVVANGKTYNVFSGSPDTQWTADVTTIASALRAGQITSIAAAVDSQKIALIGHSAGAKNSFRALVADPTLAQTIVALDVSGSNPPTVGPLMKPTLLLGELFNKTGTIQACAPAGQNFEHYYAALPAGGPVQYINFLKANHMSWLDSQNCSTCSLCTEPPSVDHVGTRRLSRRYITAWLERTLRGDVSVEPHLSGADIQADVTAGNVTFLRK